MNKFTQNVSARFAAGAIGVAMIASLSLGAAAPALAAGLTAAQTSAILGLLQSFGADQNTISNVQSALSGQATTGSSSMVSTGTVFTRALQVGSTGADVKALQVILNSSADTQVSKTGAGSPGMESSTFGPATKAAVMKFQKAHGLSQVGLVGPATRAILNSMGGTTTGTTGTTGTVAPAGPGVTIAMAATQPTNTLAPGNAARVPFTTFTLSNNTSSAVTISSVTVQRAGLAADAAFSGVVLLDSNGLQVGLAHTFNSNHQSNIGDNFVLAAGASMTYTVAANMQSAATLAASYSGQVAQMQVVAVNTTVPVAGSLPIIGASQTINGSLTVGAVSTSTSSYDPGTNQTKTIGNTGVRFSGVRFTANSSEDVKLYSLRWRQTGTAGASDFSNVVVNVNGTSYPTTVDSSGKYYTTQFPGGILFTKGNSVDVYVQGDITGSNSSSRTITMTLDRTTDAYFVGQTYGYGIAPTNTYGDNNLFPNGYITTIQSGTANVIQNATSVASANVPVNVNNTVLGGFQINFQGEPVSISGISFAAATSSGATGGVLTSVSIVDENGAVVAGPVDQPSTATNDGGYNIVFTDTITFPVGLHTYTIKGKVPSAWKNGSTVSLFATASATYWTSPTGQTSGNTIALPGTVVTMNTMTVKGATLVISASASPVAQTIVAGNTVTLANIQLDASQSGEDLRLNQLKLSEIGAGATTNNLNTCTIYNGSTALNTGGNAVNVTSDIIDGATIGAANGDPLVTFNFDSALTIPKGTVMTVQVKCNIASAASGTYGFGIKDLEVSAPTVTGVQSGNSIRWVTTLGGALGINSTASGLQNVSSTGGTLAVTVDSSSPSYSIVAAGTSGVTVGVIKLHAANENVTLNKLGLTLSAGSGNTLSSGSGAPTINGVNDLSNVYIYQGSTLVGTATFTGTGTTATSSLTTPITLVKDSDTLLTIKADIAGISISAAGGIGDIVKIDPLNAQGSGVSSGKTVNSSATAGVAGIAMFKSYPTFASTAVSCTNSTSCNGANQVLKKFSITANAAGSIGLYQIATSIATSSASVRNMKLMAYTDSNYSMPANVVGTGSGTNGQFGNTAALDSAYSTASVWYVSFIQTTPLQVSAGTTLYFSVLGDVTPTGTVTNWTINTTVLGDTASSTMWSMVPGYNTNIATVLTTRTQSIAGVSTSTPAASTGLFSNFLWSDNATTTSIGATIDWANGYAVPGLPSNGL